jgi:hypothetical protein
LKAGAISGASSFAFMQVSGVDPFQVEGFATFGTIGGITSLLQGDNFGSGFLSAGIGAMAGSAMSGASSGAKIGMASIVGGTISELTGGKFANGAVTAAFAAAMGEAAAANQYQKGSSPTSQNVTDPKSVDFISDEGVWGEVHWTGDASGVTQLQADLKVLGDTDAMADVVSAKKDSGQTLSIRANLSKRNSGLNYNIQVDVANPVSVMTTQGAQDVPSIIKLGHELPHAIMGTRDNGAGNMNNVNRYENPLRKELGYPARTVY